MAGKNWSEDRSHVLNTLKRYDLDFKGLFEKHNDLSIEVAILKVKSGVWGAIAGIIGTIGILLLKELT